MTATRGRFDRPSIRRLGLCPGGARHGRDGSALRELGARHVGYGAKPEHHLVVGEVLIASLAEVAGEAWRPEHQLAWAAAFAVIADVMLSGAAEAEVDVAA
jgi:hemoglobin-like flavoprotein